jgi:hypothetical protein
MYMTKQIFPFLFCFTRELNLYTPLTLSLRPPIRPYLTYRPPYIHPSAHLSAHTSYTSHTAHQRLRLYKTLVLPPIPLPTLKARAL